MLKFLAVVAFVFLSSLSYAKDKADSKEKDVVEKSKISSSDIEEFIKSERKVLLGKNKIDIAIKFKEEFGTFAKRYGNTKKILNLNEASLSGMDLRGTILTMSSMIKANLSGADLKNSDLVYVDFSGADLTNADLSKADLSNAVFEASKLKGANFKGANLFGAKFIKISDLTPEELEDLKSRTNSYVELEREPLTDFYSDEN
jgi:uncharacterized protein YjbI with pentapeptide repeats